MQEDAHKEISMDTNARIAALEKHCKETAKKTDDLHRMLLESTSPGEPPLIERLGKAVRGYEQASWIGKTGIWLVLTLGGLAGAGTAIMNFLTKMGRT